MAKKNYAMVMFSKELANASPEDQAEAVRMLWLFMMAKKGVKPKGKEHKLLKDFEPFFTGRIEDYRLYANAYGILFQPEVFRGYLKPKERRHIKQIGFDSYKVKPKP